MTRKTGRAALPEAETQDPGNTAAVQRVTCAKGATGHSRPVVDRWMADLIRYASGYPRDYELPPPAPSQSDLSPAPSSLHLQDRLHQAVHWGFQEREFARFETSLERQATLGEFLAWARRQCGRSVEEVERVTGLSVEHIRALEEGEMSLLEIAPEAIAKLARLLNTSIWSVLERLQVENGYQEATPDILAVRDSDASADAVWFAGNQRRKEPTEQLSLRTGRTPRPDAASIRRSVFQAWRSQQK